MTRPFSFLMTALFIIALGGCNKSGGLQSDADRYLGKWTFDRGYTEAHMPKELTKAAADFSWKESSPGNSQTGTAAAVADNVNGMMNDTLKPMLSKQLLGQLDGQTFTITPKLVTESSGGAYTYQVIEHADPNTWSIKKSNGDIWTLTSEDGRLTWPTTGDVHFMLYFKRVKP